MQHAMLRTKFDSRVWSRGAVMQWAPVTPPRAGYAPQRGCRGKLLDDYKSLHRRQRGSGREIRMLMLISSWAMRANKPHPHGTPFQPRDGPSLCKVPRSPTNPTRQA